MPRPPPPAAALTSTGKPIVARDRERFLVRRDAAVGAGHHRNAEPLGGALGLDLVAHQADVFGLRPDEVDAVLGEDFGEARILGQEAVARMHRVGAGDLAGGEQRGNVEIAVFRAAAGRCRRSRRRGARAWRRRRRWNAPRRSGCRAPCRRAAPAARSRRDWRSGFYRTSTARSSPMREASLAARSSMMTRMRAASLDDHQRLAELDRLAVLEQDLGHGARARRRESGSWSSSLR